MYVAIITAQDYEDVYIEAEKILNYDGYIAAIEYLSQWDYGYESEHMFSLVKEIDRSPLENYYHYSMNGDEYTLVEHPLYMALYRVAYDE